MEAQQFRYRPLPKNESIRLLLLQPNSRHDAELRGVLMHTTLADCAFEIIDSVTALSYVWGLGTTGGIHLTHFEEDCDEYGDDAYHSVSITRNLDAALRDLRDAQRVRRVWADALCIDQLNIDEKNYQVSLMGKLYRTAHHTVIHLGALTTGASQVFEAVRRVVGGYPGDPPSDETNDIVSIAQEDLLTREWFKRVWIFQELVLSRDPWVQCGDVRVRWTDLCRLLLPSSLPLPGRTSDNLDSLRMLDSMNKACFGGSERFSAGSMLSVLRTRRGFGATVAHDYVYAHLGIVGDLQRIQQFVDIDYDKPVALIFAQMAQYIIENNGLASLLTLIDDVDDPREAKNDGLPSWAPHWRDTGVFKSEMYRDNKMSRDVKLTGTYRLYLHEYQVLGHVGYTVDVIDDLSWVFTGHENLDPATVDDYSQVVSSLIALYQLGGGIWYSGDEKGQYAHASLSGKEAEHEGLCRTLAQKWGVILNQLAAQSRDDSRSQVSFIAAFVSWLEEQATQGRISVGSESDGLMRVLWEYFLPRVTSCLKNRRLFKTSGGVFGVAPPGAKLGDVIGYLVGCETAVLLRDHTTSIYEEVDAALMGDFLDAGGTLHNPRTNTTLWQAADPMDEISHFTLVGNCYLEGSIGWTIGEIPNNLGVFALH
ncbi:HET-domain-containing protein [Thozetella sp. PMI_491]|nr:HET-domain-containing protein [Thozetella sp. PMI_491]